MEIELRPLDLGEVLDRTIQIYRSRFLMFVGISALGSGLVLFWQGSQFILLRFLATTHPPRTILIANGALTVGLWAIDWAVLAVVFAAIYRAVADMYAGKSTGVTQSYVAIRSDWFRYVSLGFISVALLFSPVNILLSTALTRPLAQVLTGAGESAVLFTLLGVLFPIALVFSVWFGLRYALAGAAYVFENSGIVQAFRRSAILSKGQRLRIAILLVLMITIEYVIGGVVGASFIRFMRFHHGPVSIAAAIAMFVIGLVGGVLAEPIMGIGLMVCYFDARIRHEGFDVEWMLQRSSGTGANREPIQAISQAEIVGLNPT